MTAFSLLLALFLLLEGPTPLDAQSAEGTESEINWMDFEDAVDRVQADHEAGRTPRMLFIEIYADWCPYCKRLDTTTMTDPAIIELLNTHFYPVRLDGEHPEDITFNEHTFKFIPDGERGYHELAVGLSGGQLSYPTLVFMNENLQVVQPLPGYRPPDELLPILSFFGEGHYTTTPWESFFEEYSARTDGTDATR